MKTWVAISMALAISSGKQAFWIWKATEPRKVLYIEGEVDPDTQKNIQKLIKGFGFQPEPGFFQVITPNTIPIEQPVPNIATRPGQIALSSQVNWADVIFLDNLNTLASYGKENEVESWLPVQAWMGDLKRRGKSIVFIHHANKSGSSSGTRARQRASDTIISLSDGRNTPTGQKTTVSIEKGRTFYGSDKKPFSLELIENEGGICTWSAEPTKKSEPFKPTSKKLQAKAMLDEGMTAKEVAEKFGKVESTIYRWVKDLKADG